MDTPQAKFLLQSWRASGADAGDPQFAEALRRLEHDAELAAWFAREQVLDSVIGRKLREVPVPADLPESILATQSEIAAPLPRRRLLPLALAASIALLATLAVWLATPRDTGDFEAYRTRMVKNLTGLRLDFTGAKLPEVQGWLATTREMSGYAVPEGLQAVPTIGCKTWSWRGRPVALICFSLVDGRAVHLFIVPRPALPDAPAGGQPKFEAQEDWMTASWSEGGFVYIAARRGDEASLRQILRFKG